METTDAGTPPTLDALLEMVEDHAPTVSPAVVADAARRARLTIARLEAERERLEAENARLREYYEANEALEAECDEDVEAVHRAVSRWVAARRALASAGEGPSDG
jgi:uncharacterized protein YPO0396